jgi:predicted CXXCH cytochrome family protein
MPKANAKLVLLVLAAATCVLRAQQQPINFNHKLHIDQKMDCTDCHQLATKTRRSGLPTANLCMACHAAIKRESPEVQKIAQYKKEKKPIPWVRLYQLPNFVYYNHSRHINSGIACATCHGTTGTLPVAQAVRTFSMGFCMDCHQQRKASNDCATCHH